MSDPTNTDKREAGGNHDTKEQDWPSTGVRPEVSEATPVVMIQRFGFGLFCAHLSTPDMPLMIHRDKEYLELYAKTYLHWAKVPWEIREIRQATDDILSWFR